MLLVDRVSIGMQSVEKDGVLHQLADLLVHLPAEQVGSKLARSLRPRPQPQKHSLARGITGSTFR
jgi:hypothetical protein